MSDPILHPESDQICKKGLEDWDRIQIHPKGADGVIVPSFLRGYSIAVMAGCKVHSDFRKRYINPHDIENQQKKCGLSNPFLKRRAHLRTGLSIMEEIIMLIYHYKCSINFLNGHKAPVLFLVGSEAKCKISWGLKDDDQEHAFFMMCSYLEMNDEEQLTVLYFRDKMKHCTISDDYLPYGNYYLKTKLFKIYGNSINIAEGWG